MYVAVESSNFQKLSSKGKSCIYIYDLDRRFFPVATEAASKNGLGPKTRMLFSIQGCQQTTITRIFSCKSWISKQNNSGQLF